MSNNKISADDDYGNNPDMSTDGDDVEESGALDSFSTDTVRKNERSPANNGAPKVMPPDVKNDGLSGL